MDDLSSISFRDQVISNKICCLSQGFQQRLGSKKYYQVMFDVMVLNNEFQIQGTKAAAPIMQGNKLTMEKALK